MIRTVLAIVGILDFKDDILTPKLTELQCMYLKISMGIELFLEVSTTSPVSSSDDGL